MPKGMRGRTETLPPNTVLCPIGFTYVHVLRLLCVSGVPSSLASISMLPPVPLLKISGQNPWGGGWRGGKRGRIQNPFGVRK